jgi:uncharacterized protein YndB with AHSA1/START domain
VAEVGSLETLDRLAWLAGTWAADDCRGLVSEQWLAVHPRLLLGTNRTMAGGQLRTYEHLEIHARSDGVYYRALPEGQQPVEFRLVELGQQRAVFENPEHDFPRRIAYRLDGDLLIAEITGEANGVPLSRSWAWKRDPAVTALEPIRKSVDVPAPVADVFGAFTVEEQITTFFAPAAKVDQVAGGAYELYFVLDAPEGSRGCEGCTFVEIMPDAKLVFTWNHPPSIPTLRTAHGLVTLSFARSAAGTTTVELVHDGFRSGGDWEEGRAYFDRAWGLVLDRLKQRFETGPISWDDQ